MLLKDIKQIFHKELDVIYGKEEASSFFFLCTEYFYNISRLQLALDIDLTITKTECKPIYDALNALKNEKPIQYILGETEFYGLPFKVNKYTLIPRPETEELIRLVIDNVVNNKPLKILDIGTGTGCIAIALAKALPKAEIFAIDISAEALKVAKQNAELNHVKVDFIEADILSGSCSIFNIESSFDVIVSNPPYIRDLEKQEIKNNVLGYEPHMALFVEDDNPLIFYKAIIKLALEKLKYKGQLFFEINEYLSIETKTLVKSYGFKNIRIIKDLFRKDRFLKADKL